MISVAAYTAAALAAAYLINPALGLILALAVIVAGVVTLAVHLDRTWQREACACPHECALHPITSQESARD